MGGLRALCCSKADRANDDHHDPPTPAAQPLPKQKIAKTPANFKSDSSSTEVVQEKSGPRDLWKEAYDKLGPDLTKYLSGSSTSATDAINGVIKQTTARYEQWKKGGLRIPIKDGDEINIRDSAEKIINAAMKANDLIAKVVTFDPTGHASSAWMIISFGMSVVQNTLDRRDAIFNASKYLAEKLAYFSLIDANYRNQNVGSDYNLDQALLSVYSAILTFTVEVKKAQNESAGARSLKGVYALTEQPLGKLQEAITVQSKAVKQWADLAANLGDRKVAAAHLAQIKSLESKVLTAEEERQLDWISTVAYSSRQRDLQKKRTDGTGNWLLDLEEYTDWKSNAGGLLWLPGISGCGKSVLCSTAIQDLEKDCESDDSKYIAYWYFQFNDAESQSVDLMMRSLIRQLSRSPLLPSVIKIWEDNYRRNSEPDSRAISALLDDVIANLTGHVYLVLDALDECPENARCKERMALLSLVTDLLKRHKNKLHILATSRPEQDIKHALEASSTIDLEVHLDNDVRSFVEMSLMQGDLRNLKQDLKDLITEKLLSSKERRFRWAELQIAELEDCYTDKDVIDVLNSIPHTLEEAYRKILDGFTSRNVRLVRGILILICLSPSVLDLETVAAMAGLNPPESVLKICTTALVNEVDGKIRFAHFSVQEFLIVSEKDGQHHECQFSITGGHNLLATRTMDYLLDQTTVLTKLESTKQPFFNYAATYWNTHVTASMDADRVPNFQAKINRLFTEPNVYFNWVRMNVSQSSLWDDSRINRTEYCQQPIQIASRMGLYQCVEHLLNQGTPPDAFGSRAPRALPPRGVAPRGFALPIAAYAGHENIVKLLLDRGAKVNGRLRIPGTWCTEPTALIRASEKGHENIVRLLLERGADVTPRVSLWGSALQVASSHGHEKILEMLLDHNADVNASEYASDSAIYTASLHGHHKICKILLDRGADIYFRAGTHGGTDSDLAYGPSALHAASRKGHKSIVLLLLDHGMDVNFPAKDGRNALQDAAGGDNDAVFQLLLDRGANIHSNGGIYGNALYYLVFNGHARKVQMMLDRGADVNLPGGAYGSALQAAAYKGYKEITQILLDRGADVNLPGGAYGSALQAAAYKGYKEITQILLDRGADVNLPGGAYGSALQAAAYKGYEEITQMLLDRGADVNANGGGKSSALHNAAYSGYIRTVQILLDWGADINILDEFYGTTLQAAAVDGHEEIMQMMLDRGLDVNANSGRNGTALHITIRNRDISAVQMLLDRGAHVNAPEEEYNSPLQVASSEGDENIVRMLLDHGADPNSQTGELKNALYEAASRRYVEIVQILLASGADVNARDSKGFNALHGAAWEGDKEVIQILLDKGADVNTEASSSALTFVCDFSDEYTDIVQMLLDRGADVNFQGEHGTPLQLASATGNEKIVEILLDRGADPNSQAGVLWSALYEAASKGHGKIVQMLLARDADINAQESEMGLTALHAAANRGHQEIFQMLLDKGADVNVEASVSALTLISGLSDEYTDSVQMILDRGADLNFQGKYGTPLRYASSAGNEKIVKILLDHGADVNVQGVKAGETAIQVALANGHERIVQMLRERGAKLDAQEGLQPLQGPREN